MCINLICICKHILFYIGYIKKKIIKSLKTNVLTVMDTLCNKSDAIKQLYRGGVRLTTFDLFASVEQKLIYKFVW